MVTPVVAESAEGVVPRASWRSRDAFGPIIAIVDQGVSSATTFLCTALIARSTSKEEFGLYVLCLTVLGLSTGPQSASVTSPYMYRQAALTEVQRARLAGSTLIHQLSLAVLATVTIGLGAAAAGWIGPAGISATGRSLALCIGAVMLKEYSRQLSFAHRRPQDALVLDVIGFILQVGGFALLVRSGTASSASAFLVTAGACGLAAIAWIAAHRKQFHPQRSSAIADLRDNWAFGRWLLIGFAVNALSKDMYGWILTAFRGTPAAAVLAACLGIVMLSSPVLVGVSNHLGPAYARLLSEKGSQQLLASVRKGTWAAFVFVAVFVGGVSLLGEWAVGQVYGSQYLGHRGVLICLALSVGASVLTMPVGVALLALQRADLTFRSILVGGVGTVVVGIGCARAFGPLGAAVGLLSANTLESIAKVIYFRRCMQRFALSAGGTV